MLLGIDRGLYVVAEANSCMDLQLKHQLIVKLFAQGLNARPLPY